MNKTKSFLMILVVILAVAWWYWPTITAVPGMRPVPPVSTQSDAPSDAILILPEDTNKMPYTIPSGVDIVPGMQTMMEADWLSGDEKVSVVTGVADIPNQPQPIPIPIVTMVPILESPPLPTFSPPTPQPRSVTTMPTSSPSPRDWSGELTAVTRNMENAITLMEKCAVERANGMMSIHPVVIDCSMVIDNLERATAAVDELEAAIREGNQ